MSTDLSSDPSITSPEAYALAREPFMATLRELVRAYQAFDTYANSHVRQFDLTPSQFDVLATLGNTPGMGMGELAEKTLTTKGTLTGIVDRLEAKQLVRRVVPEGDRRCFKIVLTSEGKRVFGEVFPAQVGHLKERIERLEPAELELLRILLRKFRDVF